MSNSISICQLQVVHDLISIRISLASMYLTQCHIRIKFSIGKSYNLLRQNYMTELISEIWIKLFIFVLSMY